jgi:hypothetical protein
MASSGKKKTTMAKLARESRLRERRQMKQAKKDARRNAPPEPELTADMALGAEGPLTAEAAANGVHADAEPTRAPTEVDGAETAPSLTESA